MSNLVTVNVSEKNIELTKLFERAKGKLAQVAPKHITPERMIRLLSASLSRVPKLAECDPGTLLVALMTATQLGLEPNTPLGHGYVIPVWNSKRGMTEAQFWPGWRGLVHLAEQTGVIKGMRSRIVREKDFWEYEDTHEGERWKFAPADGERGKPRRVFAVAERGKDIRPQIEVMGIEEVVEIMKASPGKGDSGPWMTHFGEMVRKTAIKRLAKQLPLSTEDDTSDPERPLQAPADRFVRALQVDNDHDGTIEAMLQESSARAAEVTSAPEVTTSSPTPAPAEEPKPSLASRNEQAKAKIRGKAAKENAPPPEPVAPTDNEVIARALGDLANPAQGRPTAGPEPVPEAATQDAPPEVEELTPPAAFVEGPMFPDDLPLAPEVPKAKTPLEVDLDALEAITTREALRAWYDDLSKRWASLDKASRDALGPAYKAKNTKLGVN
jgi:recombination protein RecT